MEQYLPWQRGLNNVKVWGILIVLTSVTMINGENKAGLFAKPRGDRQLLMSTAV